MPYDTMKDVAVIPPTKTAVAGDGVGGGQVGQAVPVTPTLAQSMPGYGEQATPQDTGHPEKAFLDGGYANDDSVVEWIKTEILPRVRAIRTFRLTREEAWADAWRMYQMEHDRQGYVGRSNLYIPAVHKAIETIVSALAAALFPTDDIIDVQAPPGIDEVTQDQAVSIRDSLNWDLIVQAGMKREVKVFLRQLAVIGTSVAKIFWRDERKNIKRTAVKPIQIMGNVVLPGQEFDDEAIVYRGPVWRPVDLFNFYVWPETARSMREAEFVFEVMEISAHTLRRRAAEGTYTNVDEALRDVYSTLANPNLIDLVGRTTGLLLTPENPATSGRERPVRVIEIWCNIKLPDARARGYTKNLPEPAKITMTEGGTILAVTPNPFDHKEPPYEMARTKEILFSVYGKGFADTVSGLQHLLNDQVNQSQDVYAFCINPIVKRSLVGAAGPLPTMRPGVVWNVLNKDDITFEKPPWELAQVGMQAAQQTISMIQDFAMAPPVLQGQSPTGKGAKTAAGMRILQGNTMMPLQDIVEDIEEQCMRPTLYKTAAMREQFLPAGMPVHKFCYRWMASDQATNQQVRAQQCLEFIQMAPNIAQALQPMGKTVNVEPLVRSLMATMGLRDIDKIIVQMTPQMMQMIQQMQGTPGFKATQGEVAEGAPEGSNDMGQAKLEAKVNNKPNGKFGVRGGMYGPMGGGEGGSSPGVSGGLITGGTGI